MSTCANTRSWAPWPGVLDAREPGARWRRWAAASILGLPVLAAAAPLLSVSSGQFQSGGCMPVGQSRTAVSGPLTNHQACSDGGRFFSRTAESFSTADFGSLGASTFLTLQLPGLTTAPTNSGFARASFEGDYVFTGPGNSVAVNLNLDLEGHLAISGGNFSNSSVQITLIGPGGSSRAQIGIFSDLGPRVETNSLDDDAEFSPLFGLGGGSIEIDTNGFTVPVGVPVHIFLGLQAGGGLGSDGSGNPLTSLSAFGSTLTFNRDGPVFTVPAGFTVNGPGVVNNLWVGASPVPEPSPALMAGAGLAALVWLQRRRRDSPRTPETTPLIPTRSSTRTWTPRRSRASDRTQAVWYRRRYRQTAMPLRFPSNWSHQGPSRSDAEVSQKDPHCLGW